MITFKEFIVEKIQPIKKTYVQIEKGLTRDEALKKAPWKKWMGDKRGFSYDPETGKACWI